MTIAKLTELQRLTLLQAGSGPGFDYTPTEEIAAALDIIDAHEADRAALVKELEEARADQQDRLTAERDAAIRALAYKADESMLVSEVARLTRDLKQTLEEVDMLKRHGLERAEAAEQKLAAAEREVARLTAELAECREHSATRLAYSESYRAEVARLNEALAAAEQDARQAHIDTKATVTRWQAAEQKLAAAEDRVRHECSVSRAAEARVRELESHCQFQKDKLRTAESELAQLRERVAKMDELLRTSTELNADTLARQALEALRGPR